MSFDIHKWYLKIDTKQLYPFDFNNTKVGIGTDDPQDYLDLGNGALRFSQQAPTNGNPITIMYYENPANPSTDNWKVLYYNDYWTSDVDGLVFIKQDFNNGSLVDGGFAFMGLASDGTEIPFLSIRGSEISATGKVAINAKDCDYNATLEVNGAIRAGGTFGSGQTDILYAGFTTSSDNSFHTNDGFKLSLIEDFENSGRDAVVFDKVDTGSAVDGMTVFRNIWNGGESLSLVIRGNGDIGIGRLTPSAKLDVQGNTIIRGSLDVTGTKNFNIPDPRYNNTSKRLIHSALEGPEAGVYYRGSGKLENGKCEIVLPEYFELLTKEENRTILITPVFDNENDEISCLACTKIKNGKFIVKTIDNKNLNQEFYWEVKAQRKDINFSEFGNL